MGNKNSGRRRYSESELRRRTLQQAWVITHDELHNDLSDNRVGIAKDLVVKDMVSKEAVDMNAKITTVEEDNILAKYTKDNRLSNIN
jgi:hypothetical protein